MIQLNLGCGTDVKSNFKNIDVIDHPGVIKADITKLIPEEDESVDLILCNHILEHIPFDKEMTTLDEIHRVLKPKGILWILVPDLLWVAKAILEAEDKWNGFYGITKDITDYRYGFEGGPGHHLVHGELMTHIYGNQSSPGQFHHNGYTIGKIKGIVEMYGYTIKQLTHSYHKSVRNIIAKLEK